MKNLDLKYPEVTKDRKAELLQIKKLLDEEAQQ
jgi:hypothetical protein